MKKILTITSSISGANSYTIKLADAIIARIQAIYPGSTVKTYDLAKNPLPHLEAAHFEAFQVPAELRTADQQAAAHYSDTAVSDLMEADFVIIGVPLYNFNVPSTLKAWTDHITRAGITFSYGEQGPIGLVNGKKVFLAVASGGVYSDGPMSAYDSSVPYLKNLLGFLGMTDVTTFRAEGLKIPQLAETALPNAVEAINEYAF
ncbi:NAD(P)H-dependent oxidoreductase [Flavobacterium sp. DG1-102-2]|uniref:FMN-dependent NADH-azoreductase n=1 Tax=Flavobacterium sp. DG1-102-2 TaxID=3081663 RepID=UPI00294A3E91|nr:NAD(P)H-dependent oxidoreductase [Flavobacterium sp. DG1-102-2]MDV6167528.1 NAD(P)H-dependent oxidoreductase [Flavobacterium sp. DG1-102-2]